MRKDQWNRNIFSLPQKLSAYKIYDNCVVLYSQMFCSEIWSFTLIIPSNKHVFSYFPVTDYLIDLPNSLPVFCTLTVADKCLHFTFKKIKKTPCFQHGNSWNMFSVVLPTELTLNNSDAGHHFLSSMLSTSFSNNLQYHQRSSHCFYFLKRDISS